MSVVTTMPVQWFRAHSDIKGFDRIDHEKGIIFGVAINTEGEAKGHGVHLEKSFVEDVAAHGNASAKGLKARFGHPNMSSSAVGTYVGRYKNFRTEETVAGGENKEALSVCRADLHLSESSKKAPQGDLYSYVLEMAEKEPDMFGLSIVFSKKGLYHYDENGRRKEGRGHKTFVELGKPGDPESGRLHACDVVDEPAANPSGLFSEFTEDLTAARLTQFLDENPQVLKLYHNPEIREAFIERYQQYLENNSINKEEEQPMAECQNSETKEKKGLLSKLAVLLGLSGEMEGGAASFTEVQSVEQSLEAKPEAKPEEKENPALKKLEAKVNELADKLQAKDQELSGLKSQLKEAEKKLCALGVAFKEGPQEPAQNTAFSSFTEAVKTTQAEMGISYDEAHSFCAKEYPELYPKRSTAVKD